MANTVSLINYANTFGDWVIVTDAVVNEINTLGKGNYTKDTGLLTLAGSGIGLQVANNSLFQGNVVIGGTGQALQVQHDAIITGNLSVGGNVTFSGFEVDYQDITSNTIHANTVTINTAAVGKNNLLNVSSDLIVSGNLFVGGNTTITGFEIDFSDITSNTIHANTLTVVNETVTGTSTLNALAGAANVQIIQEISDSANTTVGTALAFSIALG